MLDCANLEKASLLLQERAERACELLEMYLRKPSGKHPKAFSIVTAVAEEDAK
jgi:hypothetical protein